MSNECVGDGRWKWLTHNYDDWVRWLRVEEGGGGGGGRLHYIIEGGWERDGMWCSMREAWAWPVCDGSADVCDCWDGVLGKAPKHLSHQGDTLWDGCAAGWEVRGKHALDTNLQHMNLNCSIAQAQCYQGHMYIDKERACNSRIACIDGKIYPIELVQTGKPQSHIWPFRLRNVTINCITTSILPLWYALGVMATEIFAYLESSKLAPGKIVIATYS